MQNKLSGWTIALTSCFVPFHNEHMNAATTHISNNTPSIIILIIHTTISSRPVDVPE
jgi:hypothetical protein